MPSFITPLGFSGLSSLTSSNGLVTQEQGLWQFSQAGYNDGITWGVSLGGPRVAAPEAAVADPGSGVLDLRAENWSIAVIGNELTAYTDPDTGITYGAERCRIQVRGRWSVPRRPNSNSFNGPGVIYSGVTDTDEGSRLMGPALLDYETPHTTTYRIQGSAVEGGAEDTFSGHVFFCRVEQRVTTDNSNRAFQSNSIVAPQWIYSYSKSWQID
jgi:hypothetical protein